ncbi:pentatricopeptide repeat-containing protein At2g22410, mitochondrial-like [Impatiens glandulifera]|uniref:pentatricopeptide repeat-containing protein At2g22410, mitochondrial-like n=1 Tax=Impatiens glandulifera TaxID=253017 RepID=UPI001FB0CAB3|nr:pentatricopeptide repeat-containing protein At2g22410, mitochondrial-like [Impatiens glandulifera]
MRPALHFHPLRFSPFKTSIRSFSFLTLKPRTQHFSSSISYPKPKWNSNATLLITNPVLHMIESCNSMLHLKQIQGHMTITGLIFHLFPVSRVLTFCALSETGDIHHAIRLFSQISKPNVYMWNTMIRGYTRVNLPELGLSLFRRMFEQRIEMDRRSFVFALKACELSRRVEVGELIHSLSWKMGFDSDSLVQNALIHFYSRSDCLFNAVKVFDESPERDVVSWTTMIDAYSQNHLPDEALNLFNLMLSSGIEPNYITMITVLSACSQKKDLTIAKSIHEYMKSTNVKQTLNLTNALLDMYVKCGCLLTAEEIFRKMEVKDVFSWTSMINGYSINNDLKLARECFDQMPYRNIVSWNAMIAGYSQNNQPKNAVLLFHEMTKAGFIPIENTLVCVLSACAQLGFMEEGRKIKSFYIDNNKIRLSLILANAFIDMYAKCGDIQGAEEIFHGMKERDLITWNSMIMAYASHGYAEKALIIFNSMQNVGFNPDDITFIAVLSACSHGGLAAKGKQYFETMELHFGLTPKMEHYACMVDVLGRNGLIEEAYEWITKMPMEPDEAAWGALLNACRMFGNLEFGQIAGRKLLNLNPNDSGIYMNLTSIYSKKEKWLDVTKVRSMMREKGVKKMPGCSSIEVGDAVHEFLAADESHPLTEDIYRVLRDIVSFTELENEVMLS